MAYSDDLEVSIQAWWHKHLYDNPQDEEVKGWKDWDGSPRPLEAYEITEAKAFVAHCDSDWVKAKQEARAYDGAMVQYFDAKKKLALFHKTRDALFQKAVDGNARAAATLDRILGRV